jgi:hypothetical protein
MVRYSIFYVNMFEILKPLAGEIGALEAPRYTMLTGAGSETRLALYARWHHLI